ncbi:MAG TPA: hypothetical protein VLZ30_05645 [Verrucomicrobiae bacterium]|nr:hypothetical protein [Verrucomicrobiae bacterium]
MKRSFWISALFLGTLVVPSVVSGGQPISPVGSWEVVISGAARGTSIMTFSNDTSVSGYGILRKQFGLFTLTGNWGFDTNGNVVVACVQALNGVNTAISFTANVRHSGTFQAKGSSTAGALQFKGATVSDLPDLTGTWTAVVKRRSKTLHETYTITVSTNLPAVFNVTGSGLSDTGSFTLTGNIIATSNNKLNASIDRTFGVDTQRSSLYGRFKPAKPELALKGVDDSDAHLTIKALQ